MTQPTQSNTFPNYAQSDVTWLKENGPDGELTQKDSENRPIHLDDFDLMRMECDSKKWLYAGILGPY